MKIAVFEMENWEQASFDKLKIAHQIHYINSPLSLENASLHTGAQIICPFIYSTLNSKTLENFPELKLIATRSTGFDHIDIEYCKNHNIAVANVPYYGDNTVAEHVFGLLLTISHNLNEAINRTRRGDFSLQGLRGFDLQGKTLGIIGTGRIGRHVAKIAKGFEMNVLAYDIRPDNAAASHLGFEYVGFDELLAKSDIITVHVPAADVT